MRACYFVSVCFLWFVQPVLAQQAIDPDSVRLDKRAIQDFNPFGALYSMNSWTMPVLDHEGKPHKDGDAIQLLADGGNGIQDPPNMDGSPGGDDSLAEGNFNVQFVNGVKHAQDGLEPGMFMGMRYFVPYKINSGIYLRMWEGEDPPSAKYYQDTEEYVTFRGDRGGAIFTMEQEQVDDIDWRFGPSKEARAKR